MGKYQSLARKKVVEKSREVHVAWRGIGCLMMLVIPVISIAAAVLTIDYGLEHNWTIPYQLLGFPRYPDWFYASNGLMTILSPITNTRHFYAYAIASIIYMILLGGIMSVVYAYIYRLIGPSRYSPLDVPPPNIKVKKYKR
jgi:drug/metabolite transporter (DMT)-like permease